MKPGAHLLCPSLYFFPISVPSAHILLQMYSLDQWIYQTDCRPPSTHPALLPVEVDSWPVEDNDAVPLNGRVGPDAVELVAVLVPLDRVHILSL